MCVSGFWIYWETCGSLLLEAGNKIRAIAVRYLNSCIRGKTHSPELSDIFPSLTCSQMGSMVETFNKRGPYATPRVLIISMSYTSKRMQLLGRLTLATLSEALEYLLIGAVSCGFGVFVLCAMPPGSGRLPLLVCFGGVTLMTSAAIGSTLMKD
jgi:hypothetical protein